MRNSVFIPLQDAKEKFLNEKAVIVSKAIVGNYYKQLYKRKKSAIKKIQKNIRMFLARNRYTKQKKNLQLLFNQLFVVGLLEILLVC